MEGLDATPDYFPLNVLMNTQGYDSIDEVLERGQHALSPDAFEAAANETNALILDTRKAAHFAKGFIPNSINIGIDGNFAPWVGTLIKDIRQEILLVTEEGREEEAVLRLARVGYDFTIGYLKGGFNAWKNAAKEVDHIEQVTPNELASIITSDPYTHILDVRKNSEYSSEHLLDVKNIPLELINESMAQIDKSRKHYVHCAGGYRSMIFISILKARGFDNLVDIKGGFNAIKESGKFTLSDHLSPTTML